MEIRILVEAYCPTTDDVDELSYRFFKSYSDFADFAEIEFSYNEASGDVHFVWLGNADELSDEDFNELIRLTHHAEALYEDSSIERTHVEVCVNGKWYGRLTASE